ncbi:MAG: hypothetical protein AEth_00324 [Candidatus Argoarchaeum ethanivorans]|uniref:Uncharacterized protein n=1 Tax=Candidatus Argoarchaeum ethanivorans TaxID=2608793 RepID=A0A8B3S6G7_9EURY|nr:MAG: hypothetical protein AEth_00324 [Candidatus Argoarchaeum ethanivorans]
MTGIVVSNTTPLIYLAKADDLHISKKLFENIYIPTEVCRETVESGFARGYSDARRIGAACNDWIIVKPVSIDLGLMLIRNASRGIDEM